MELDGKWKLDDRAEWLRKSGKMWRMKLNEKVSWVKNENEMDWFWTTWCELLQFAEPKFTEPQFSVRCEK